MAWRSIAQRSGVWLGAAPRHGTLRSVGTIAKEEKTQNIFDKIKSLRSVSDYLKIYLINITFNERSTGKLAAQPCLQKV